MCLVAKHAFNYNNKILKGLKVKNRYVKDELMEIKPSTYSHSSGKVREIYDLNSELLLVASDRISAYDVILPTEIPDKGRVLTGISLFWFQQTAAFAPNHLLSVNPKSFPDIGVDKQWLAGRSMLVKKAKVIPFECIVRGYLSGSAWVEYRKHGTVNGQSLPQGLKESEKLPTPLFTPTTKAAQGHDEPVTFEQLKQEIGASLAQKLKDVSLKIYNFAAAYALERGVIIADTKFEFGLDEEENLLLIDELLTPDSSRFWPLAEYTVGQSQPSFDKQFIRDYLDSLNWGRTPPAPALPDEIVKRTQEKYLEAYTKLTGKKWSDYLKEIAVF